MGQVPAPVLLADFAHKLAELVPLDRQEHLEEFLAQGFLGPRRVFQGAQGGQPVGRQGFAGLLVAVADDLLARIDLIFDPVMDAGEDRRSGQVRIGIGAADAVLITEYRGLTVRELAGLRNAMRPAGGEYKVYKNTLVRIAARELGIYLDDVLVGPTALALITAAPDGTPADIVNRIQQEVAKSLATPAMKERLLAQGAIPGGNTPAEFAKHIDNEHKKWAQVVKTSGAKVD